VIDSSWARFDVVFFRREWLEGTTPSMRLAWAEIVLYVKATAPSQKKPNRATSLSARTCSRMWEIPVEEIEALLSLAIESGQLKVDGGSWVVTELSPFVSEKTQKTKEAEQEEQELEGKKPEPAESDLSEKSEKSEKSEESGQIGKTGKIGNSVYTVQDSTGQVLTTANAVGEQQPAQQKPPAEEPSPPEGTPPKRSRAPDPRFERLKSIIARCHEAMGFEPPTDADVRRELKAASSNLSGLLAWLEELPRARWLALAESIPKEFLEGPTVPDDAAVAMWVLCRRSWAGAVTWPAIYGQRDAIIAKLAASRTRSQGALEQADDLAAAMDARLAGSGGGYGRS
jgi:hypothetical protein